MQEPLSTPPRALHVTAADGVALHCLEWRGGEVPCLFLHGLGQHARVWDDVVPFVPHGRRVLALDHRGHGASAWSAERRYGIDALVDDVLRVLDALALDRVVLVGHSLGGHVAIRVAAVRGAGVRGLVVVEAGPELKRRGVRRVVANERHEPATYGSIDEYVATLAARYPFARRELLAKLARHELVASGGALVRRADPAFRPRTSADVDGTPGIVTDTALADTLAGIRCSVLVVRGAASSVLRADAVAQMVATLPDARAVTIRDAGHAVPLENPEALGAAIAEFLGALAMADSHAGGTVE